MEFSVLMSAYSGTRVEDLAVCLESLRAQTVLADEIVLVLDGPLSEDTANYIKRLPPSLPIKTVSFSENRGLGHALREGRREQRRRVPRQLRAPGRLPRARRVPRLRADAEAA